jgi:glutathione synthase/RimK-type ligase-like ATP-grasp enzyme
LASDELEGLIQRSFAACSESEVVLTLYFGREASGKYERLGAAVFGRFPIPLLRTVFVRNDRRDCWTLKTCTVVPPHRVPEEHQAFLVESARAFLRRRTRSRPKDTSMYDLAILRDPAEREPPSDERALKRFEAAAEAEGFAVEFIGKDDYARVAEFDALFVRETTAVNHRTFRFAQRAAAEGLVVMDDPESILRCTNKVFLAEVLARHKIRSPPTVVLHRDNVETAPPLLGFPCVLKQPDSSFSQGVVKVDDLESFRRETGRLLQRSDLIVAQAFMPTAFDWRIGVLARRPLFACKYYMARRHWQIIKRERDTLEEGGSEAVPLEAVPAAVLAAAVAAANLMGDGLYGVDLKEVDGKVVVIEVNDNPSIDGGFEDALLGDTLYREIMREFRKRLDAGRSSHG